MDQKAKLFIDLPSDIFLRIFDECDVLDVLSLSSTCKWLQQMTDEHQVWLHQARRLQVPIPPGTTPSKAELKDLVISRTRVDVCWIKRRPGDLVLHSFETNTYFVDAHLIPGGEFVVLLYRNGDIGLNKIERSEVTGELKPREVARYEETNEDDCPHFWSRLLTETSYGCPVLVWVGAFYWEDVFVFLIDPVSQIIQKKECIHLNFDDPNIINIWKTLAVKDRLFFICEGMDETAWITIVEEPGPKSVTSRFNLTLPTDYDISEVRFFVVSENGLVVTNHLGIWLYHIPELRIMGDSYRLGPAWGWEGDVSECRGTLYKTESPYPALWLQGERTTHTLELDVDESGCFPVVVSHRITEGQPAYYEECLKLQGRKGMGVDVGLHDEIVFNMGVLGKPDMTRRLYAALPGFNKGILFEQDEVKYVDLDEATGRIMVVVGLPSDRWGRKDVPYAWQLYLADLPV